MKHLVLATLLAAISASSQAAVVATNSEYAIFDSAQATRALNVATHGTITDLNVILEFSKCDDPGMPANGTACIGNGNAYNNEILFSLTSPNGTTVDLITANTYTSGSAGIGRITLTLDDAAFTAAGGNALVGGSFRPTGTLSSFNGMDMFGSWTLFVGDNAGGDPLTYFRSSLNITTAAAAAQIPEPGSLMLLGLGLAGLLGARRRKQA